MNNEQQQINKAVKKGVNKLVAFAVEFKPKNGNWFSVEINPNNGLLFYAVWNCDDEIYKLDNIAFPRSIETIDNFNCKVETLIAEIKRDYK